MLIDRFGRPMASPSRVHARIGPQPQPEAEAALRVTLRDLDPLLDVRWFHLGADANGTPQGRYGLTCQWPQSDKRWEMYRTGEIGEPYDILGWLTEAIRSDTPNFNDTQALPTSLDGILPKVL